MSEHVTPQIDPNTAPWYITFVSGLIVTGLATFRAIWNRRFDAKVKRTPTWSEFDKRITELRADVDKQKEHNYRLREALMVSRNETRTVKSVLRAYSTRVTSVYPQLGLSASEQALLDDEPDFPDIDDTIGNLKR